jgi:concanavalin A-like lectin/glucanase superfamily protein
MTKKARRSTKLHEQRTNSNLRICVISCHLVACILTLVVVVLMIASVGYAQNPAQNRSTGSVTWKIDNLKKIGGHQINIVGEPQVIKASAGKAVLFDGVDDGLIVDDNPLAGAEAFTVEAVFRPDSGGSKEQRWFHIQDGSADNRVLLEIRLNGDEWFLDTFIKSGTNSRPLYAENFKHRVGQWYHVALVFDGTTMRHYVDSHEELSGALTISPLGKGSSSIGVRMNRVFWFKGAIRRVRFTPRALLPKEFMSKN